jgi:protein-disulfide isomerase
LASFIKQSCGPARGAISLRRVTLAAGACAFLSLFVSAQDKNSPHPPEPLAIIDGQTIDDSQLPPGEQAQVQRMMQQVYAVKLRALHGLLDQRLVEAEAKKKGVSVDDLMKSEVISKVAGPSDDELSAYYKVHQGDMKQPFDEIKEKLRQEMKDVEIKKAQIHYIQGLWQRAATDGDLVLLITPPKIEMPVDPARLRGDPNAPVTIVEFSDFSCPFCRKVEPTLAELLAKYPGKVKLVYRDFPLSSLHPQAHLAAEASRCAGEQGKYWEYHDLLFANQARQTQDALLEDARTLKLDDQKLDACLTSGRYKSQVDLDSSLGGRAGVVSTPGFFINGNFISGAQPAASFEKIIDEELSASSPKGAAN